ncbi:NCS2 family permease [Clostridium algidicarnis]|uniref:NCS2 family permease n=1 Tax=Clostridium algidicarnis TaxID=37659 RepID=UPI0016233FD5|nr:NCS2 family permease [Clostridium algidicarnis]MBB6632003.1 NCS2 family permease [Clostridium algidicarnis]MBU3202597.1 NCS2 family permease [Clostridium algidicarnis]MBU3210751.1 NCS2 family permease [Clostridium algidicarnis]MBU3222741.1 NCS2 family permease [Clostridium algidicarnis]MCB2287353.1 NCS2 family permease [Clostridium algidicarnis]
MLAGLTSFFAAAYIIAVNPAILADAGIPMEAAVIATVLSTFVGCLLSAFWGKSPMILVPGMGVNAMFSYTIVKTMGLTWEQALASVFIAGILFAVVAFTKLGEILTKSIPTSLKEAITVGIGLMITFIGLQKSGIIVSNETTFVALGNLSDPAVYVTLITLIITLVLFVKNVQGNFLISMFLGVLLSAGFGLIDLSQISFSGFSLGGYKEVIGHMDFSNIFSSSFIVSTFSILLVLIFENLGLIHGQVNVMLGKPEKFKRSFQATAMSVINCAIVGTSPTVVSIEGAAGIAAGGKSGLTSFTAGILFLLSIIFMPIIKIIPNSAIAPILIIIGSLMIKNVLNIDLNDFTEGFPAFLIIAMIPLTFSIVDGMAFGFVAYPIVKLASKKHKEISVPMYIISFMFLINFILHAI